MTGPRPGNVIVVQFQNNMALEDIPQGEFGRPIRLGI
jgi:hypothetical protein